MPHRSDEPFRFPAAAIGTRLPSRRETITPRRAMAYAAGIGSSRRSYFRGDGVVPPGLIAALEWPLVNGREYRAALGVGQEQMQRAVHVRQATLFRRPLQIGQVLETSGRIVAMRQSRAGVLIATRLRTQLVAGPLVATSLFVTLTGTAELEGEGRNLETLPAPVDSEAGETRVTAVSFPVPPALPHLYTECAQIWNPIHTEPAAAARAGLPGIVLHGTCSWAMAIELAIDACCDGDPAGICYAAADFRRPVFPGTEISFELQACASRANRIAMRVQSAAGVLVSGLIATR